MDGFADAEWSVDVINDDARPSPLPAVLRQSGCHILDVSSRRKQFWAYMTDIYWIMKSGNYCLVHIHGSSETMALELAAARVAKIPVRVAHSHNIMAVGGNRSNIARKIARGILRAAYLRLLTDAFACSRGAGEWLNGGRRFSVLPNCIDLDRFRFCPGMRKSVRERHEAADSTLVIGHVGHQSFQKNQGFLIDLAAALPKEADFEVWLLGQGDMTRSFRERARDLGVEDRVRFLGVGDAAEYLQAFDLFALPSRFEGFCTALLEAQAAGLMCLAHSAVETVTVTVTVTVTYLPLRVKDWAREIADFQVLPDRDRASRSGAAVGALAAKGYDAGGAALKLKRLYREMEHDQKRKR
jgi:glycosyltransferase involved in cell wall biosynthesis